MFRISENFFVLEESVQITVGARSVKWFSEKLEKSVAQGDVLEITPDLIPAYSKVIITGICPICSKQTKTSMVAFGKRGSTSLCGKCKNFVDSGMVGKRFGTLTVLRLYRVKPSVYGRGFWVECSCDCDDCIKNNVTVVFSSRCLDENSSCTTSSDFDYHCSVEGCKNNANKNGMCREHYRNFLRYGDPSISRKTVDNKGKLCGVEGCERDAINKGMCKYHYDKERLKNPVIKQRQKEALNRYMFSEKGVRARTNSGYNRRAVKANALREDFKKDEIYLRDGWICQLCGLPVDPSSKDKKLMASLDHIIPLSRGGSHTRDNVQLAHRGCNSQKHNKLPEEFEIYKQGN